MIMYIYMVIFKGKYIEYIENDYMYLKLSKIRNLVNIIIFIAIILYTLYFF